MNHSGVDLGGQIDHLDLDNIFQNNKDDLQSIMDEILFDEGLTVGGNVTFEGFLNGFNISELCGFMSDGENGRRLIIGGNSGFILAKGTIKMMLIPL